jgi:hypothetical protein
MIQGLAFSLGEGVIIALLVVVIVGMALGRRKG